jgi:acyl-coenzyme A synthetase/AMP-(fatty) acid ligase
VPFLLCELLARGALDQRDLSSLRWVLFGGEIMAPEVVSQLMVHMPNARFSNSYGPAEVNQCTFHHLEGPPGPDEPIPIGRPLPDAELRIVDDDGFPVEGDAAGELLVRCSTMMDRYWNRPDLDTRAFVHTDLPGGATARWYRTGDVVRRRPDGDHEFLGRRDNQVKVRGNRVELESVESVLAALDGIEAAVAGVVELDGTSALAAALLEAPGATVDLVEALRAVARALPPYAVPFRLVRVDDLPLTASGKVDRRAVRDRLADQLAAGREEPAAQEGTLA